MGLDGLEPSTSVLSECRSITHRIESFSATSGRVRTSFFHIKTAVNRPCVSRQEINLGKAVSTYCPNRRIFSSGSY